MSPSRSGAAAPDTESGGAAAGGRKRARAAAQGATNAASPARRRLRTNLARSFAHGGWSRRSTGTSAARPRRASGLAAPRGQTASLASGDTSVQPAADDDGLQDTIDMIGEGELDRVDAPAARSSAAPTRGATSEAGGPCKNQWRFNPSSSGPIHVDADHEAVQHGGGLAAHIGRPVQPRASEEYLPDVRFGRGRGGGDCGFIIHRPAAARARSWRRLRRGDGCGTWPLDILVCSAARWPPRTTSLRANGRTIRAHEQAAETAPPEHGPARPGGSLRSRPVTTDHGGHGRPRRSRPAPAERFGRSHGGRRERRTRERY